MMFRVALNSTLLVQVLIFFIVYRVLAYILIRASVQKLTERDAADELLQAEWRERVHQQNIRETELTLRWRSSLKELSEQVPMRDVRVRQFAEKISHHAVACHPKQQVVAVDALRKRMVDGVIGDDI